MNRYKFISGSPLQPRISLEEIQASNRRNLMKQYIPEKFVDQLFTLQELSQDTDFQVRIEPNFDNPQYPLLPWDSRRP